MVTGTKWDARDRTRSGHLQGKYPIWCSITSAPTINIICYKTKLPVNTFGGGDRGTSSDARGILLTEVFTQESFVQFSGDMIEHWESNPVWLRARQAPDLLYYHFGPH